MLAWHTANGHVYPPPGDDSCFLGDLRPSLNPVAPLYSLTLDIKSTSSLDVINMQFIM